MFHRFFSTVSYNLKNYDGVQDMVPQNIAPWHTEYFKLKESEHTAWAGSSPSDLSHPQPHPHTPCPCPLKQVIKPSSEKCPPYNGRNPYLQRQEVSEESKQMGLVKFPLVYYTYLTPFTLSYLSMTCHSTSNPVKTHRFNSFFESSFPYEDSHDM